MNRFTVMLDSCVLYPANLRSLLLYLAENGLFRAKWSDAIHEEWIRNVLKDRHDLSWEKLQRTRMLMEQYFLDANVAGYETLIEGLTLPDPDDRHVVAAAIHSRADLILTFNLKDFPEEELRKYHIEVQHPDRFLLDQLSLDRPTVLKTLKEQRESLKHPEMKSLEFLEMLERQQLPMTVAELRKYADLI